MDVAKGVRKQREAAVWEIMTGRHQTRLDRRKSKERGSRLKAYASRGQNGGPDQWLAWGSPEPQERDHGWILQNAVLSYVARKGTVKVTALA